MSGQHAKTGFLDEAHLTGLNITTVERKPLLDPGSDVENSNDKKYRTIGGATGDETTGDLDDGLRNELDEEAREFDEMTYLNDEGQFFNMLKERSAELGEAQDAATVASSAVDQGDAASVYSGVPTSIYSKKYNDFADKLAKEQQTRAALENKIK